MEIYVIMLPSSGLSDAHYCPPCLVVADYTQLLAFDRKSKTALISQDSGDYISFPYSRV